MNHNRRPGLGLTWKMLLMTLCVGIVVSLVLDMIQTRSLQDLFEGQTRERLRRQAIDDRLRFDHYLKSIAQATELFAAQPLFADYLESRRWGGDAPAAGGPPEILPRRPSWHPPRALARHFPRIRIALLLDREGRPREIYNPESLSLPESLTSPTALVLAKSLGQVYLTSLEEKPYMLAAAGYGEPVVGYLLLALPLDVYFLQSFAPVSTLGFISALVSGTEQRVVTSSVAHDIPAGTTLRELQKEYFIAGKEFFDYGNADVDIGFVSLVRSDEVRRTTAVVLGEARLQRGVVTLAIIVVCVLVMLTIVGRIREMARHVTVSEKRLLGGGDEGETVQAGDELVVLDRCFDRLLHKVEDSQQQAVRDAVTLKLERDLARQYLDIAGVIIVLLDRDGRVQLINRKGCQVLGCEEGNIVGCDWFDDFLPADQGEAVRAVFQQAMDGREPLPAEHENMLETIDGRQRLIVWHNVTLVDGDGRIAGTLSSGEDITDKRASEREREQLISELQTALSEVKTLSGMLPICSWCKKIRNDDGYWDQIEGYILRHSEAVFSHSVCPTCMKKHYPEYCDDLEEDS